MPVVSREGSLFWMMDKVDARVTELMNKFRERYEGKTKFAIVDPDIIFAKRGVVAGTSMFNPYTGVGQLNFNRTIMKDNWDKFDQTVIHEVAHHCCGLMYGKQVGHGRCWKVMMWFFGAEPERCHSYDVTRARTVKTYKYSCGCGEHDVSSIRHKRIIESGKKYHCTKCKQTIKYIDNI